MVEDDLATFERWLREPHFARWFLQDSTLTAELEERRRSVSGETPTVALMVDLDGRGVGWCQWYDWSDYSSDAAGCGALPGEIGIDYGIGESDCIGRGVGTRLIAALVAELGAVRPGASIRVGPSAANAASRAVLERNGFVLVELRELPDEPQASPIAMYRLAR